MRTLSVLRETLGLMKIITKNIKHQQNRKRRIYLNIVGKNIHQQLKLIAFLYQLVYLTLINNFHVVQIVALICRGQ